MTKGPLTLEYRSLGSSVQAERQRQPWHILLPTAWVKLWKSGRYGCFHRRTVIDRDAQEVRLTLPNGVKRSARVVIGVRRSWSETT
jgi:hypothetical protein